VKQPVEICGRDASLRFDDIAHAATRFEIVPEEHNKRTDLPKGYEQGKTPPQPEHLADWVNCIRSRGTPKCSTDEAFVETATFLMSLISYQQRRMVRWDAVKEEIV
jgi:predicted dehydrogenase